MKSKQIVSAKLKAQIVGQIKEGKTVAELASQHQLATSTIYKWLRDDLDSGCVCNLKRVNAKLQAENEDLLKIIGRYRADEVSKKR